MSLPPLQFIKKTQPNNGRHLSWIHSFGLALVFTDWLQKLSTYWLCKTEGGAHYNQEKRRVLRLF